VVSKLVEKKQSQFAIGQINVSYYLDGTYDNKCPFGDGEKQSQTNPVLSRVEWANFRVRALPGLLEVGVFLDYLLLLLLPKGCQFLT
jgi:hypothetical protein